MDIEAFTNQLNLWGRTRRPFVFVVDFEMEMPKAWPVAEVDGSLVFYDFNGVTNKPERASSGVARIHPSPIPYSDYKQRFDVVMKGLLRGDSFLTNLTISTPIQVDTSLEDLFYLSDARYKFLMKDEFLVFSPETFVHIKEGTIRAFPMKGTMPAGTPGARAAILANAKEKAEHITIVDLIRNDISMVADNVQVDRFRYLDEIRTNRNTLLQVSSEISGRILPEYRDRIGSLLVSLLPAGSVSGAPKSQTVRMIKAAEQQRRGYYTGVCGHFDGETLDCGVMIRFIEKKGPDFFFRSGGGITTQSSPEEEYQETLDKIYVPVF
jgi:para-aminobenzoate synthetase component 1